MKTPCVLLLLSLHSMLAQCLCDWGEWIAFTLQLPDWSFFGFWRWMHLFEWPGSCHSRLLSVDPNCLDIWVHQHIVWTSHCNQILLLQQCWWNEIKCIVAGGSGIWMHAMMLSREILVPQVNAPEKKLRKVCQANLCVMPETDCQRKSLQGLLDPFTYILAHWALYWKGFLTDL